MSKKLPVTFKTDLDTYDGGKSASGVPQKIINNIPPHMTCFSGFLGNCCVMQFKEAAAVNIGVDMNINTLRAWHKHDHLHLIHGSVFEQILYYLDDEEAFIFLDPPYLFESRKKKSDLYKHELTRNDHIYLLQLIRKARAMIMICCYPNQLYKEYLPDWHIIEYKGRDRSGATRTEWLMINYLVLTEYLHDFRYVGNTHRERDDMKSRLESTIRKFNKMSALERNRTLEILNKMYAA